MPERATAAHGRGTDFLAGPASRATHVESAPYGRYSAQHAEITGFLRRPSVRTAACTIGRSRDGWRLKTRWDERGASPVSVSSACFYRGTKSKSGRRQWRLDREANILTASPSEIPSSSLSGSFGSNPSRRSNPSDKPSRSVS